MKDINKLKRLTEWSFVVLILLTILKLIVVFTDYLNFNQSIVHHFLYQSSNFYFVVNAIIYLVWYHLINRRYVLFEELGNSFFYENISFIVWFIPFANVFLPYGRLLKIIRRYRDNKFYPFNLERFLDLWVISFTVWVIVSFYIFETVPLFGEDIDIYYGTNPNEKLMHDVMKGILELVGLLFMRRIIIGLNFFDSNIKDQDLNRDVIDHLIN